MEDENNICPFVIHHNGNDVCAVCKTFICSGSEQEKESCPHTVEVRTIGEPKTKMYAERKGNIPAFRGCDFNCTYCAFKHTMSRSKCTQCRTFTPHAHLGVLDRRPPPTKEDEFLTMGLNGDIAFASEKELVKMLLYCNTWEDRTFVLQTKDPSIFEPLTDFIKPNMIIGTTIESDIDHGLSKAPTTVKRYEAMRVLDCRKMVTVEPILTFNLNRFYMMLHLIKPEVVYIGYDSKNNKLPEPTLDETNELFLRLREHGFDVREKLMRKAWYE